jgi:hypothetical protein
MSTKAPPGETQPGWYPPQPGTGPVGPPGKKHRGRNIAIAVGSVVALIVIIVVATGGGGSTKSTRTTVPATSPHTTPAPTRHAAPATPVPTHHTSPAPTPHTTPAPALKAPAATTPAPTPVTPPPVPTRQVSGTATTLGAGTFSGGTDVAPGLYDVTPGAGQSGNFFVQGTDTYNEILGTAQSMGVPKVRVQISAGTPFRSPVCRRWPSRPSPVPW